MLLDRWAEPSLFELWLPYIILSTVLYYLPCWIAHGRHHPQRWPIFWLTVFTGWTGFGWIAAFVWAVVNFRSQAADVTT
jgi:Superinfection immunity protein